MSTNALSPMPVRGADLCRLATALALGGSTSSAMVHAEARWPGSRVDRLLKSAIDVGSTTDVSFGSALVGGSAIGADFLDLVAQRSVLGRLVGVRSVPFNVPVPSAQAAAEAFWIGEASPTPLSRAAFDTVTLLPTKVAANVVVSMELLRLSAPPAEALIRRLMTGAAIKLTDTTLLDPANAGVPGVSPASITFGVVPIAATADFAADIATLLAGFGGDLEYATFVANPLTAALLGLRSGGKGIGSDLGGRGGTLAGFPLLVSPAVAAGTLILVDASALLVADGGIDVSASKNASVEMESAPTDPATAATVFVSLWQRGLISVRLLRLLNFQMGRANSVAILTGVV